MYPTELYDVKITSFRKFINITRPSSYFILFQYGTSVIRRLSFIDKQMCYQGQAITHAEPHWFKVESLFPRTSFQLSEVLKDPRIL